jgi:hypothetical protein
MPKIIITIKDRKNGRVDIEAESVPPLSLSKMSPAQSIGYDALQYIAAELVEKANITSKTGG